MESAALTSKTKLSVTIEADPLSTLENVLAIIRRLGMELYSLHMQDGADGVTVQMHLSAGEESAIAICCKRLRNVIGISCVVHEYGEAL